MVRTRPQVSKKGKAARIPAPEYHHSDGEEEEEDVAEAEGEDDEDEGAAGAGDDEEVEDEENLEDMSEGEEEEEEQQKKGKKKKRNAFVDDEAGEASDDEEEEERGGKKKKPKRGKNAFIDDEADAGTDDEDDEEDEDEDGFIVGDSSGRNEAKEAKEAARALARDREAAQRLDRKVEEEDVEKLQNFVKERFGKDRARGYKEGEVEDDTPLDREARQPGVNDPKLWMVKCRQGKERETVVCLMQKWTTMKNDLQQRPAIMSAFAQDHLKGYIYVEAEKEPHVRQATKGLQNIFHSQPPRLVPIREMVESISVTLKTTAKIVSKSWARVRAGTYKNDLCFVDRVEQQSTTKHASSVALVKLVPRLDFQLLASREKITFGERNKRPRPPAKLLNIKEAREAGLAIDETATGDIVINGTHTFRNGFLIKEVSFMSLRVEPSPPFEELQRFAGAMTGARAGASEREAEEAEDELRARGGAGAVEQLAMLAATLEGSEKPQSFRPGDKVKVVKGDLKGLTGVVASVSGDGTVNMTADHKDLQGEAIALKAADLAKNIVAGMHVRVTAGRHDGATGMVVRVDGDVVVLITDILKEEIQVFGRDLTEAGQTSSANESLGSYMLHDLVILEGGVPGVIVKIEHQAAMVLTSNGTQERPDIRTCRLPDIQRKIMGMNATAQDNVNNTIGKSNVVTVVEGALRGKNGGVLWCHRGFVFILCREVMENGGVLCVRARSVKGPGAGSGGGGMIGGVPMSPVPGSPMPLSSPQHLGGASMLGRPGQSNVLRSPSREPMGGSLGKPSAPGGFSGAVSRGPGRVMDDPLVGKRVKVCKGAYKGYKGIVIAATNQIVRLELEANEKTVTVNRTDLDESKARPADVMGMGAGGMTPGREVFGRTPMHASMTPGRDFGGMTPSREAFGMTPSRDAFGMTPGRDAFGMTPGRDFGNGSSFGGSGRPTTPGGFGLPFTGTPGNQYGSNQYGTFAGGMGSTPAGWGTGRTPTVGTPGGHTAATPDTTGYGSMHAGTPHGPVPGQWDAAAQEVAPSPRQHNYAGATLIEGVEVALQSGEVGVVASVAPDRRCRVDFNSGRPSVTALSEDLLLVAPRDKERVIVLEEGPNRGRVGLIVGHDEDDVLVQYEDNQEVGLQKAIYVGKFVTPRG